MTKTPLCKLLCPESEKPVLEALYLAQTVASDQLRRDPKILNTITAAFNRFTGRNLDPNLLVRYIFDRRKAADWPRLGSRARKFESVLDLLTSPQLMSLKHIYLSLDITSDELLFAPASMRQIAQRFHSETGDTIPGSTLVAVIVAKRKRGKWVGLREEFADIAVVEKSLRAAQ